jgi:hypothetical protein
MIQLESITQWFAAHGQLRKSQRKTLAALVWALLTEPLLGVAVIGRTLARAKTTSVKHAVKRVDRFLGNGRIDLEVACGDLIAQVVGTAAAVFLTLDWTDLKTPDHAYQTLSCHVRAHGRAIPIAWTTVRKTDLTDQMRAHAIALCQRVARLLPPGCHPILLADRGFAATTLFRTLDALGWDWIIRSKGSVQVQLSGQAPWRGLWTLRGRLPGVVDEPVTYGKRAEGGPYAGRLVVYADAAHLHDPWYLMVSAGLARRSAQEIAGAYGQRFTCEETYRDQKNDPHQGFHLDCVTLSTPERWDRLWLVFAWAYYWLNVAGWAVEARGAAARWRANTAKIRTHALWRLGIWGLQEHLVHWRTMRRAIAGFVATIPRIREVPEPSS